MPMTKKITIRAATVAEVAVTTSTVTADRQAGAINSIKHSNETCKRDAKKTQCVLTLRGNFCDTYLLFTPYQNLCQHILTESRVCICLRICSLDALVEGPSVVTSTVVVRKEGKWVEDAMTSVIRVIWLSNVNVILVKSLSTVAR